MGIMKSKQFLIETDVLIAAVDRRDPHHGEAADAVREVGGCVLSPYALMELDLLIRSGNVRVRDYYLFWSKLSDVLDYYGISVATPSPLHYAEAFRLRSAYKLTYFNSLHAATAILERLPIISYDTRAYAEVSGLRYVHPSKLRGYLD